MPLPADVRSYVSH